ncbi:S41 family peptidase [Tepidibacillus infernus]|uniref:S41 family peptidase n=1 Tax=Tepidibacillus infernus TaxID=1806172 RepID=UPI003B6B6F13
MSKKWLPIQQKIIAIILVLSLFSFIPNVAQAEDQDPLEKQKAIMNEIYELIEYYHLQGVDPDELMQGAIWGMIDTLGDPYTAYFTDEEYQSFTDSLNGSFVGIGVVVEKNEEGITVQTIIPGSPAEEAGLQVGDLIKSVEGISTEGKTLEQVTNQIKGEEGTSVTMVIQRDEETMTKTITRGDVYLPSVESEMLTKEIGYLRLYAFGERAADEFKQHLEQLKEKGMKKLILDLRDNPGGYLDAALKISKNFIKEGPIVYVKDNIQQEEELAIQGGTDWNSPMVVLINEGTASASEILTGALKDYNKATIVGTNSFGKGVVQSLIRLENGGYLKLTTNEYFTPKKNKMNKIGIKPDIMVEEVDQQLSTAISTLGEKNIFVSAIGSNWIQENNKDYVALRPLVHALGGKIFWNSKSSSLDVVIGKTKMVLTKGKSAGFMIKDGQSFLTLAELTKQLPELKINKKQEILTIYLP